MDREKKSMLMIVFSMLIFGTVGLFRRSILLPSEWIAFARGILGGIYLLFQVRLRGQKLRFRMKKKSLLMLLLAGAIMGANWILLFESYRFTTVAIATLCYYMQPIIVILLSPIFFRETLTKRKLLCAFTAVIGMFFVSGVFSGQATGEVHTVGILFGLGAALLYAVVVMMNKKIPDVPANERTILQLFAAAIALLPYLAMQGLPTNYTLDSKSLILLFVISFFHTGFAYALYFHNIQSLKTQTIAILSYIDPVSALLFSTVFLKEHLSKAGMLGAVLIIGAAFFAEVDLKSR